MANQFFWYDVMTTDTAAATKFYCDVVGWGAEDSGVPGHYTLLTVNGHGVAGLMAIPEEAAKMGAHPAWMGYIHVDDVDAMAASIKTEGGKVLREPMDVPGVIRFAVVADPQGAGFMIAKPVPREGQHQFPPGTTGTVGWRELYAGEWQSAFAFYEKLFGWTKAEAHDMGPMGTYQLFAAGAEPVGGMMTKPPQVPAPPYWSYYLTVDGIDTAVERVNAGGGKIINGPMEVPGGQWIVQALDPQGAFFALVSNTK